MAIPHRRHPDLARGIHITEHMQDDPSLRQVVEMQPVVADDVQQDIRRKQPLAFLTEMVVDHIALLLAAPRAPQDGYRPFVCPPAG
jgi:hypothetical protein